jgi:hypothetical protein
MTNTYSENASNVVKEERIFNKAYMDLQLYQTYELWSAQARAGGDFSLWFDTLGSWLNKLVPEMQGHKELKDKIVPLDYALGNASVLMGRGGQVDELKSILNGVERELFIIEKAVGFGNPKKRNEFAGDEKWE